MPGYQAPIGFGLCEISRHNFFLKRQQHRDSGRICVESKGEPPSWHGEEKAGTGLANGSRKNNHVPSYTPIIYDSGCTPTKRIRVTFDNHH